MPEESLSLDELQAYKRVQEAKADALRQTLHNLRTKRLEDWQARFAEVQSEVIEVVTRIGQLERRIRAAVEGEAELLEENGGG
jgi:hypothetical protein